MAWSSYNQPALQALICGGKANPVLDELGDRAVFVSMRDVADVLGISPETFRTWRYNLPLRLKDLPPLHELN